MDIPESITVKCPNCGGTSFQFEPPLTLEQLVTCDTCLNVYPGQILRDAAANEAKAIIKAAVKKDLKGIFRK